MRKTQEEVKAELQTRRKRYEARRKAQRTRLLGGGAAFAVCLTVVLLLGRLPFTSPERIESGGELGGQESVGAPSTGGDEGIPGEESPLTSLPLPESPAGNGSVGDDDPGGDTAVSTEPSEPADDRDDESAGPKPPAVRPSDYDLMAHLSPSEVETRKADDRFTQAYLQFAVELLQQTMKEEGEKGALVSPLSAQLTLAMIANGADGETLAQMEAVLGNGMSLSRLNEYLHSYTASLPSSEGARLQLAGSIWFPENGYTPREKFLQTNADYYGAGAYQTPPDQLCGLINDWVNTQTDGKINSLFDGLPEEISMALVNTILFDGRWKEPYTEDAVAEGRFTSYTGRNQWVTMMHSTEEIFLQDSDGTVGFLRPYEGGRYAFAALLPAEGEDILDYVSSLTADRLRRMLQNRSAKEVRVSLPKFTFSGDYTLNDALAAMGMPLAFDKQRADFARMFDETDVYLDLFKQKTVLEVSECGVVAAGASGGLIAPSAGENGDEPLSVYLGRPFVYMILDTKTNLPLFLGVLTDIR